MEEALAAGLGELQAIAPVSASVCVSARNHTPAQIKAMTPTMAAHGSHRRRMNGRPLRGSVDLPWVISETTPSLYENVAVNARKVSVSPAKVSECYLAGDDCPSVSSRECFDCDFCAGVRYCLAAQIVSPGLNRGVDFGNNEGMPCVDRARSGAELMHPARSVTGVRVTYATGGAAHPRTVPAGTGHRCAGPGYTE
ncbi:hypothetical protein Ntsu_27860 [Nocardia sp. IFM 10818]